MAVPAENNKVWLEVVTGKKNVAFSHLGLKMFMGRVGITLKSNPDKAGSLAKELFDLVNANITSQKVLEDIKQL